jgi:hypothetical protein
MALQASDPYARRGPVPKPRKKKAATKRPSGAGIAGVSVAVAKRKTTPKKVVARSKKAGRPAPKRQPVDPVIAAGDALYEKAKASQKLTPRQEGLRRDLRAAYANPLEGSRLIGQVGRLGPAAEKADPLITVTEKLTQPFMTPATVAGSLIDADPTNAVKQLVSASYWGKRTLPSEALQKRGLLTGNSAADYLLRLGADVAPSFALPGLKTPGRAAGTRAAKKVSREQRLPRSQSDRVPHQDQAAHPLRRPKGETARAQARDLRSRRQQRAVRLQPGRGPDIITTPRAKVVRTRPVRGGASVGVRGGRAAPAVLPKRRRVEDLPYAPTPRAQRALEEFYEAVGKYEGVTVRMPTRRQAATAGVRQGKAEAALAAAERGVVQRANRMPKIETEPVRAEIGARLPGGVTKTNRPVRYSPQPKGAAGKPNVRELAPEEMVKLERVIADGRAAMRDGQTGQGDILFARRLIQTVGPVQAARTAGVPLSYAGVTTPRINLPRRPSGMATPQQRAIAQSLGLPTRRNGRMTVARVREMPSSALKGTQVPNLRLRVNRARDKTSITVRPGPTGKQIGKAGQRLVKAEAKLRKVEKRLYGKRSDRRTDFSPTARQREIHRDTFTGSLEREWIDANIAYEVAMRGAMDTAPIGINITGPWNRRGKGVTIPFATRAASVKFRELLKTKFGEAIAAYRIWVVSQYGPNPIVRAGALAADDVVRMQSARTARFIRKTHRKYKITPKEDALAAAWLEGTARGVVPDRVKEYARALTEFTERNADEFIQAGGQLKRFGKGGKLEGGLDMQYVMHLLPRNEQDRFLVSALNRRRMLYGSTPGFQKHRTVLTIAELKRAGFHPEEELAKLTFARAMAHHRAMAEMELTRIVERRFGKRVDDAPDDFELLPSQFTEPETMVPRDVAETLRNVTAARMRLPMNKASEKLQQANQWWKEWALLTSGHDIRNQFGDSVLTFQRTANPIAPLLALTFGAKTLSGRGKVGGKSKLTSAQARRNAEVAGMRSHGLLQADVFAEVAGEKTGLTMASRNRLARSDRAIVRGVRTFRSGRESLNRTGIYSREIRKGEGTVHASREANETVYDYADVGRAVQFARRSPVGAPFATWLAKNLPNQIKLAMQNPAQMSAMLTALESLYQQTGGWPRFLQPDYFRQSVPIAIPGYGNTGLQPPVNSLNILPASLDAAGLGQTGRQLLSQLAPLVQGAFAVKGIDPLTGRGFKDVVGANKVEEFLQQLPGFDKILGPPQKVLNRDRQTGEQIAVAGVSGRGSWAIKQFFPGFGTAGRLYPGEGRDKLDSIRGPLLGHSVQKFFDPVREAATLSFIQYRATRELIPEFEKRLKANAPNWRRGDPIPKPLRGKYNEIKKLEAQALVLKDLLATAPKRGTR